jgi:quercetin dioxygenase-like cupin family protein
MDKPGLWKLAPEVVFKPWGLVHTDAMRLTGISLGLGELWLASAQAGPGSYSNRVVEPNLRRTLAELVADAAGAGEQALGDLIGTHALAWLRRNPLRGKTEAWHVRAAEGRTGIAAGPTSPEAADVLGGILRTTGLAPAVDSWPDEVRALLGIVEPLHGGEVFLVPAGTMHTMFADGPDSRLIIDEIQQGYGDSLLPTLTKVLMVQNSLLSIQIHPTDQQVVDYAARRLSVRQDLRSNPTVRLYDFGRRPGEQLELGLSLLRHDDGARRVQPVKVQVEPGHSVQAMVADPHFTKMHVSLSVGGTYGLGESFGSYHVLHCRDGAAELRAGNRAVSISRGDTVFVPGCLEDELVIEAVSDCSLLDDCVPAVAALSRFLGVRGAGAGEIEALISPAPVERPARP